VQPVSARPSVAQHVVDQRERLLAVTTDLVAEHGYELLRLRDIADAAGVSVGLLQHYFDTRENLMGAAFARHCTDTLLALEAARQGTTDEWERISAIVRSLAQQPDPVRSARTWVEFVAAASRHPALRPGLTEVYTAWRRMLRQSIAAGRHAGRFKPVVPVADAAELLMLSIDGCLLAMASDANVMTIERFEELFEQAASSILHVPAPAPAPAPASSVPDLT
jgi:AcrR family transcriptional regulator